MLRLTLVLTVTFLFAGCAGPNRLSRGLDLRVNQLYVDSPTLAEVLLPVTFVGANVAMATDMCFVNPWYFWNDVGGGRGTAYFYSDPVTPENALPAAQPGAGDVPGNGRIDDSLPPPSVFPPPPPVNDVSNLPNERPRAAFAESIPHTVQAGDTLASISRRYYGTPQHWKRIYMANQNVLTSADAIKPGLVLSVPPLQ